MQPSSKAFTLLELLIVMSILAILISIAMMPNFRGMQNEAKETKVHGDLRTLRTALEAYYKNHNMYPAEEDYQTTLIAAVPQIIPVPLYDPFGTTNTTPYTYMLSSHDPSTSFFYIAYSLGLQKTGTAMVDDTGTVTATGGAIWATNGNM